MNEFRFLAPDGRYGTVSAENFSSVYSAGGVPVEAMPEVDVMSPDGMLSTLRHEKASELIKTQGYKLAMQPRPLRFASPDGRTGTVKVGLESAALGQGGTLLLDEIMDRSPREAVRDPVDMGEAGNQPGNWAGRALRRGYYKYIPGMAYGLKGWAGSVLAKTKLPGLEALGEHMRETGLAGHRRAMAGIARNPSDNLDTKGEQKDFFTVTDELFKRGEIGQFMKWVGEGILEFVPQTIAWAIAGAVISKAVALAVPAATLAAVGAGTGAATGAKASVAAKFGNLFMKKFVQRRATALAPQITAGLKAGGMLNPAPALVNQLAYKEAGKYAQQWLMQKAGALGASGAMYTSSTWTEAFESFEKDNPGSALTAGLLAGVVSTVIPGGGKHMLVRNVLGDPAAKTWGKAVEAANQSVMARVAVNIARQAPRAALEEFGQENMAMWNAIYNDPDINGLEATVKAQIAGQRRPAASAMSVMFSSGLPGAVRHTVFSRDTAHLALNRDSYRATGQVQDALHQAAMLGASPQNWAGDKAPTLDASEVAKPAVKRMLRDFDLYRQSQSEDQGFRKYTNAFLDWALKARMVSGEGLVFNPSTRFQNTMAAPLVELADRARETYLSRWQSENPKQEVTDKVREEAVEHGAKASSRRLANVGNLILMYDKSEDGITNIDTVRQLPRFDQEFFDSLVSMKVIGYDAQTGKVTMRDPRGMSLAENSRLADALDVLDNGEEALKKIKERQAKAPTTAEEYAKGIQDAADALRRVQELKPEEAAGLELEHGVTIRREGNLDVMMDYFRNPDNYKGKTYTQVLEDHQTNSLYHNSDMVAPTFVPGSMEHLLAAYLKGGKDVSLDLRLRMAAALAVKDLTDVDRDFGNLASLLAAAQRDGVVNIGDLLAKPVKNAEGKTETRTFQVTGVSTNEDGSQHAELREINEALNEVSDQPVYVDGRPDAHGYSNTTPLEIRFMRHDSVATTNVKTLADYLSRKGYLTGLLRTLQAAHPQEDVDALLGRVTRQQLLTTNAVRSEIREDGKEWFVVAMAGGSDMQGLNINLYRQAGKAGQAVAEETWENTMNKQARVLETDGSHRADVAKMRKAYGEAIGLLVKARKNAERDLFAASKSKDEGTAESRAAAAENLALVESLPDLENGGMHDVQEFLSKYAVAFVSGFENAPFFSTTLMARAFEALRANGKLSVAEWNSIRTIFERNISPNIRQAIEYVSQGEVLERVEQAREVAEAKAAPAKKPSPGKPAVKKASEAGPKSKAELEALERARIAADRQAEEDAAALGLSAVDRAAAESARDEELKGVEVDPELGRAAKESEKRAENESAESKIEAGKPKAVQQKTGKEWAAEDGTVIMDPDGWSKDGVRGVGFDTDLISWDDYVRRAAVSTAKPGAKLRAALEAREDAARKAAAQAKADAAQRKRLEEKASDRDQAELSPEELAALEREANAQREEERAAKDAKAAEKSAGWRALPGEDIDGKPTLLAMSDHGPYRIAWSRMSGSWVLTGPTGQAIDRFNSSEEAQQAGDRLMAAPEQDNKILNNPRAKSNFKGLFGGSMIDNAADQAPTPEQLKAVEDAKLAAAAQQPREPDDEVGHVGEFDVSVQRQEKALGIVRGMGPNDRAAVGALVRQLDALMGNLPEGELLEGLRYIAQQAGEKNIGMSPEDMVNLYAAYKADDAAMSRAVEAATELTEQEKIQIEKDSALSDSGIKNAAERARRIAELKAEIEKRRELLPKEEAAAGKVDAPDSLFSIGRVFDRLADDAELLQTELDRLQDEQAHQKDDEESGAPPEETERANQDSALAGKIKASALANKLANELHLLKFFQKRYGEPLVAGAIRGLRAKYGAFGTPEFFFNDAAFAKAAREATFVEFAKAPMSEAGLAELALATMFTMPRSQALNLFMAARQLVPMEARVFDLSRGKFPGSRLLTGPQHSRLVRSRISVDLSGNPGKFFDGLVRVLDENFAPGKAKKQELELAGKPSRWTAYYHDMKKAAQSSADDAYYTTGYGASEAALFDYLMLSDMARRGFGVGRGHIVAALQRHARFHLDQVAEGDAIVQTRPYEWQLEAQEAAQLYLEAKGKTGEAAVQARGKAETLVRDLIERLADSEDPTNQALVKHLRLHGHGRIQARVGETGVVAAMLPSILSDYVLELESRGQKDPFELWAGIIDNQGRLQDMAEGKFDEIMDMWKSYVRRQHKSWTERKDADAYVPIFVEAGDKIKQLYAYKAKFSELFGDAPVEKDFNKFFAEFTAPGGRWSQAFNRLEKDVYGGLEKYNDRPGGPKFMSRLKRGSQKTTPRMQLVEREGALSPRVDNEGNKWLRIARVVPDPALKGDAAAYAAALKALKESAGDGVIGVARELIPQVLASTSTPLQDGVSNLAIKLQFFKKWVGADGGEHVVNIKAATHLVSDLLRQFDKLENETENDVPASGLLRNYSALWKKHGAQFVPSPSTFKVFEGMVPIGTVEVNGAHYELFDLPFSAAGVSSSLDYSVAGRSGAEISLQPVFVEASTASAVGGLPSEVSATTIALRQKFLSEQIGLLLSGGLLTSPALRRLSSGLESTNPALASMLAAQGYGALKDSPEVLRFSLMRFGKMLSEAAGVMKAATGFYPAVSSAESMFGQPSNTVSSYKMESLPDAGGARVRMVPTGESPRYLAPTDSSDGDWVPGTVFTAITDDMKSKNIWTTDAGNKLRSQIAWEVADKTPGTTAEQVYDMLGDLDVYRQASREFLFDDPATPFRNVREALSFFGYLQGRYGLLSDLSDWNREDFTAIVENYPGATNWRTWQGLGLYLPGFTFHADKDGKIVGVSVLGTLGLGDNRIPYSSLSSGGPFFIAGDTRGPVTIAHQLVSKPTGRDMDLDASMQRYLDPLSEQFRLVRGEIELRRAMSEQGFSASRFPTNPDRILDALAPLMGNLADPFAGLEGDAGSFDSLQSRWLNFRTVQSADGIGLQAVARPAMAFLARTMRPASAEMKDGSGNLVGSDSRWLVGRDSPNGLPMPKMRKAGELNYSLFRDAVADDLLNVTVDLIKLVERAGPLGLYPERLGYFVYGVFNLDVPELALPDRGAGESDAAYRARTDKMVYDHVVVHTVGAVANFFSNSEVGREWARMAELNFKSMIEQPEFIPPTRRAQMLSKKFSAAEDKAAVWFLNDIDRQVREGFQLMRLLRLQDKLEMQDFADLKSLQALAQKFLHGEAARESGLYPTNLALTSNPDGLAGDPILGPLLQNAADTLAAIEAALPSEADPLNGGLAAALRDLVEYAANNATANKPFLGALAQFGVNLKNPATKSVQTLALSLMRRGEFERAFDAYAQIEAASRMRGATVDYPTLWNRARNETMRLRAEDPALRDNALLNSLFFSSYDVGRDEDGTKGKHRFMRVQGRPDNPAEMSAAWDALPMDLQIDLYELSLREAGAVPGPRGSLMAWVSPAFVQARREALAQARANVSRLSLQDLLSPQGQKNLEYMLGEQAGGKASEHGGRGLKSVVLPNMEGLAELRTEAEVEQRIAEDEQLRGEPQPPPPVDSPSHVAPAERKVGFKAVPKPNVPAAEKQKAPFKSSRATNYIGFGEGSTGLYREQAEAAGVWTNQELYRAEDVVFVSVNGTPTEENFQNTLDLAVSALNAGATLLTDSESYLRSSTYNRGERRLAEELLKRGFKRTTHPELGTVGVWAKSDAEAPVAKAPSAAEAASAKPMPELEWTDASDHVYRKQPDGTWHTYSLRDDTGETLRVIGQKTAQAEWDAMNADIAEALAETAAEAQTHAPIEDGMTPDVALPEGALSPMEAMDKLPEPRWSKETIDIGGRQVPATVGQAEAMGAVKKFLDSATETVRVIAGYAGTGKTTLTKSALRGYRGSILLAAPTHKARVVLSRAMREPGRDQLPSVTVAKLLSKLHAAETGKFVRGEKPQSLLTNVGVLVVDEASMIKESDLDLIVADARKNGAKVLFMGDPKQLPPIRNSADPNYNMPAPVFTRFTSETSTLTDIVRQGKGNPLLALASVFRGLLPLSDALRRKVTELNDRGEGVVYYASEKEFVQKAAEAMRQARQENDPGRVKVVAYRNKTRARLIAELSSILFPGAKGDYAEGMLVTGYNNVSVSRDKFTVINSADYAVASISGVQTNQYGVKGRVFGLSPLDTADDATQAMFPRVFVIEASEHERVEAEANRRHSAAAALARGTPAARQAWREYFRYVERNLSTRPLMPAKATGDSRLRALRANLSDRIKSLEEARARGEDAGDLMDLQTAVEEMSMMELEESKDPLVPSVFQKGFAITAHKAQGSTYDQVFIHEVDMESNSNAAEVEQLKYTAVTRARRMAHMFHPDAGRPGGVRAGQARTSFDQGAPIEAGDEYLVPADYDADAELVLPPDDLNYDYDQAFVPPPADRQDPTDVPPVVPGDGNMIDAVTMAGIREREAVFDRHSNHVYWALKQEYGNRDRRGYDVDPANDEAASLRLAVSDPDPAVRARGLRALLGLAERADARHTPRDKRDIGGVLHALHRQLTALDGPRQGELDFARTFVPPGVLENVEPGIPYLLQGAESSALLAEYGLAQDEIVPASAVVAALIARTQKSGRDGTAEALKVLDKLVGESAGIIVTAKTLRSVDPKTGEVTSPSGMYTSGTRLIEINPALVKHLAEGAEGRFTWFDRVLAHELAHAALFHNVGKNDLRFRLLLTQAQNAAREAGKEFYGLKNTQEFVAEALTNPDFREFLAGVEAQPIVTKPGYATLWDAVRAQIARVLSSLGKKFPGIQHSLLEQAFDEIMQFDVRDALGARAEGMPAAIADQGYMVDAADPYDTPAGTYKNVMSTRTDARGAPDADHDLKNPSAKINVGSRTIARRGLPRQAMPDAAVRKIVGDLDLLNVLVYREPLLDGSPEAGRVHDDGILQVADPRAAAPVLAAFATKTVGESNPMLSANVAPDIAQALRQTARLKFADAALSSLLEAEMSRRLSGAPSLFSDKSHWAAQLAADLADRLENHAVDTLRHGRIVRRGNRLVYAMRPDARTFASNERELSPNDSVPWSRAIRSDVVPEALRARLSEADSLREAVELISDAADKDAIDDRLERVLRRSAAESLPFLPFTGSEKAGRAEQAQFELGHMIDSVFFRDAGNRFDALMSLGVPGLHHAYYEMMNELDRARAHAGPYLETEAGIYGYGVGHVFEMYTDKKGRRRFNLNKRVPFDMEQRQILMRYRAAVTALSEMSAKFDLGNPEMLDAALAEQSIVHGPNRPRYLGNERAGILGETESIANVMRDYNAKVKPLLLSSGRTEAEVGLLETVARLREQYDADVKNINAVTRSLLGEEFLDYRSRYAPHFYGWAPSVDPAGEMADRDIKYHLRHSDRNKTLLRAADGSPDKSVRSKRTGRPPTWTQAQQELLAKLAPKAFDRARLSEPTVNVVQANRMILNAIRQKLYDSAAEHYAKTEHPGEWKPSEYEQQLLATADQLISLLNNFRFTEFAPAEFPRTYATYVDAYTESEGELRPQTMDFIELRKRYLDRTYAAAANKTILNSYLRMKAPDGRPMYMAKPTKGISMTHGVIREDTWRQHAIDLADYYGVKFDPKVDVIEQVRAMYDEFAGADTIMVQSPKVSDIVEWRAVDKDSASLLKKLIQLSPTDVYPIARAVQHLLAWTKHMSVALSAFFHVALGESAVGMSGPWRQNLVKMALTNPKEFAKFAGRVKDFKLHRRYYNPDIAADRDYLVGMGMTTGRAAALETYSSMVEQDAAHISHALAERWGQKTADLFTALMFGSKSAAGLARLWPGLTGKKFSDEMFAWFSAIKEAQADGFMKRMAIENGFEGGGLVPWNMARAATKWFDDGMGGQNWHRYIWATPAAMFGLNVTLFSPNWTLSAWNTSGLAPLTQALFKNYPSAGQQKFIWTQYMPSMLMWTMIAVPVALQMAAYGAGKALGGDEEEDVPLPWMNEPGRKQHIDITPLLRNLPFYRGEPTGKRRVYVQLAKQVHETGVLNPLGSRGWINEPWNQFMRKLPMPAKMVYEQLTGESPGSNWTLEFKDKGWLGWFTSGQPGIMGPMRGRLGYIAQKFIPMSASQFIQNPEVFPFNHLAPTSKGASQSKIIENMVSVLDTYASGKDWHRIRQNTAARESLDSLMPEFMRAAEANGYDAEKLLNTAKGITLGRLYKQMWEALDRQDETKMKSAAASIWRVGGTLKGLNSSLSNRERTYGKEITPEMRQQANDAMNWAMYGSN